MSFYSSESTLLLPLFNLFIFEPFGLFTRQDRSTQQQKKKTPAFYFTFHQIRNKTKLQLFVETEKDSGVA